MLSSSSSSLSSVSLITVRLSILHISLSLLCFFGTRDASAFAKDDDDDYRVHHDTISSKKPIDCGVYLAPSSIPFSGLGMYVGNRSYEENDIVTDEDIVIPIFEREWHTGHRRGKVRGGMVRGGQTHGCSSIDCRRVGKFIEYV